jgi:hypothetical protein
MRTFMIRLMAAVLLLAFASAPSLARAETIDRAPAAARWSSSAAERC